MTPRHVSDELLDALSFLIMQVSDPLARLVFEFRKQPGHVLDRCALLFGLEEALRQTVRQTDSAGETIPEHLRRNIGLLHHLIQSCLVSPFHGILLPVNIRDGREYRKTVKYSQAQDTVELVGLSVIMLMKSQCPFSSVGVLP